MNGEGALVIFGLFMLRIGIPLLVLLGLGYIYERMAAKREMEARKQPPPVSDMRFYSGRTNQKAGYSAQRIPCWELRQCTPEQMAQCSVPKRPEVPCWLTRQLVEGTLPELCLDCDIYRDSSTTHLQQAL